MKRNPITILGLAALAATLAACGNAPASSSAAPSSQPSTESSKSIAKTYTVAFEVEGQRYKTAKVKEGEKVTDTIASPTKEGYEFKGWLDGETLIDLSTYVVTKDVTLKAKFEQRKEEGPVLNVEDTKDATKTYSLVVGWWEVKDPDDPTKVTSSLTPDSVRVFYKNVIAYMKANGATDADIAAISFRNYSTKAVADMGAAVNKDGDVDLMIGVGNNINSTAGVSLYEGSNDYKFATAMGTQSLSRYVACTSFASENGVALFEWLKKTDEGKASFLRALTDAEIAASILPKAISLSVTVHGDTNVTTKLESETATVTMPNITVAEGKVFNGFATSVGGEVALQVAADATLTYDDLAELAGEATSLDLYPVISEPVAQEDDLVVSIQINGDNLKLPEAQLLEARFRETLTDESVVFHYVEGNADAFKADDSANASDVLIGGNNPLKDYTAASNGPLANAGAKHFASTNRKVLIRNTVSSERAELAKKFYDFVVAEAPVYDFHTTYWRKGGDWITDAEFASIKAGIASNVATYYGVPEGKTMEEVYNVTETIYDTTKTKVAELGEETLALREGKGTDLIVGCGGNVTTTGLVAVIEKKDIPASIVAASRQVALVKDSPVARHVYDTYFVTANAE